MPELKPLKTSPKKRAAIRRGTNQIIEMDDGLCGMTQDALDMLDDLENMSVRENVLVDALKACANAMIIKFRVESDAATVEDLEFLFSRKDHDAQEIACELLTQYEKEEHQ